MTSSTAPVPLTSDQLDGDWLTKVLRASGALRSGRVRAARCERIGIGRGFASQLFRLHLEHEGADPDAPSSVVAKLPPAVAATRQLTSAFGFDRREIGFYRDLAADTPVHTPRCHFAALHDEGWGALLLEDLTDADTRIQREGASAADAELILDGAARLHARYWDDANARALPWASHGRVARYAAAGAVYQARIPRFIERTEDWLPAQLRDRLGDIAARIPHIPERDSQPHCTVIHGDYRLENFLFRDVDGRPELSVLDWQFASWSIAAYDLAYFFAGSLTEERRAELQQPLLRRYHERLLELGVRGYDFDTLLLELRRMLLVASSIVVVLAGSLDDTEAATARDGAEGDEARAILPGLRELFDLMSRRTVAAILDNDCLSLL